MLLEKYGFCANIAVIGVSIGHTTYKDTDIPITPHFSLEDARPWIERGVLTVTPGLPMPATSTPMKLFSGSQSGAGGGREQTR